MTSPGRRLSARRVWCAKVLAAIDLDSFVKTTGGRGLHVVIPLVPGADWSACLEFARGISEAIERSDPNTFTTKFAKAGRDRRFFWTISETTARIPRLPPIPPALAPVL